MPPSAASNTRQPNFESRSCGDAGPFAVYDFTYRGLATPVHAHDWCSIHWVIGGGVDERYAGAPRAAQPGRMLWYAAGVEHQTRISRDARIIHLPMQPHRSAKSEGVMRTGIDPALFVNAMAVACRLLEDDGGSANVTREFTGFDLGERLADAIARRSHALRRPAAAKRLANLLAQSRGRMPLHDSAARSGLSRGHAARVVRAALGCSIGEFHRARQIMRATPLLLAADTSLASIAHSCGFSDQSHFGRAFRECVGVTPGAFRQMFARQTRVSG